MRIAFVEWPEALSTDSTQWSEIKNSLAAARPDLLVTNEMPFGPWIAEGAAFSDETAQDHSRSRRRSCRIDRSRSSRHHLFTASMEWQAAGQ